MKNLFIIAVALFNIYNNMMVVKNLTGFCGGEQGAVKGVSIVAVVCAGGVDKRRLWPACSRHIVLPLDTIKNNGKIFEIVKLSIKTR